MNNFISKSSRRLAINWLVDLSHHRTNGSRIRRFLKSNDCPILCLESIGVSTISLHVNPRHSTLLDNPLVSNFSGYLDSLWWDFLLQHGIDLVRARYFFRFSPSYPTGTTITSADFSLFVVTTKSLMRPPQVRCDNFPLMSLLHLLYGFRAVLDFTLSCKLIHPNPALYEVSVRQCKCLPPASFRFHLTVDTLAIS